MPCIRSTDRYIAKVKSNAAEGILRTQELLQYLNDLNLPKVVSLSEDATRVTSRIQYDKSTKQLVGFVLPLSEANGMPITGCNQTRSAAEFERCFYDVKTGKEKKRSTNVNVVMAQPLVKGIPAFCLLLFGADGSYTAEQVQKRWKFIVSELRKNGIEVITFSSDSDSRYNSVMRRHLNLGRQNEVSSGFPAWFNTEFSFDTDYIPVQDMFHIGTKFRNGMLNKSMKFGKHNISVKHLEYVVTKFTKEKHKLCMSTVNPKDRMNVDSVIRICDEKVISLLSLVTGSEGTVLFLKILNKILRSFLDITLTVLERIRYIWFAVFILRIWREFIVCSKYYTLDKHFLTTNCYSCVEINAHSLVILVLYLRERKLDHFFHPEMFSSQQCESIFRQIRSLSSTYSTVTNCNVLELIQKISKIELQNQISHIKLKNFHFPRIGKPSRSYYPFIDRNGQNQYQNVTQLPSQNEIIEEIELAKMEAIEFAESMGVSLETPNEYVCKIKNTELNHCDTDIEALQECLNNIVINEDNSSTATTTENNIDEDILQLFSDINLREYSEKINIDNIDENSIYIKVRNNEGKLFCVKKNTLCWILDKSTSKLSSDRLVRVQLRAKKGE